MKNKTQIIKGCALALIPTSLCATMAGINVLNMAHAESSNYATPYRESLTITNASFETSNDPYSLSNSLTGWKVIDSTSTSKATSGIINTIDDNSSSSFAKYKSSKYFLDENPLAHGSDTKILMINSKVKSGESQRTRKGYSSSSITLQANSYYKFSVAVKTTAETGDTAYASIYLNGLKDKDGEDISLKYEGLHNTTWQEVYFFVATGKESQTITLDLYLGSANGETSEGAVFFDDVQGTRFSEIEFYEEIKSVGFVNDNFQTAHTSHSEPIFVVNELLETKSLIAGIDDYNFDFEDPIISDTNTLGDEFTINEKSNGHALIQNIADMQSADFKALTGYEHVGTDWGKDNKQALILFTGKYVDGVMQNESGYVGVDSKQIDIKAHAIYKISMKVKVAGMQTGSFYFKVQENDEVLNTYKDFLTDDEDVANSTSKTLYTLSSGSSSTVSSNTENDFENDYQTISFYLKGNSLYDSSVNLELWLGDSTNNANGCVIVDNIIVEYATYSEYDSASDKLELTSTLPSDENITNGAFNTSENQENEENYLVSATNWTVDKNDSCDSGIITLFNEESFNEMYKSNREKYPWAGIYPNHINISNLKPNNVYLMNNRISTSQSITSSTFSLATTTENDETCAYHKLSFNYYTQNGTTQSKIKVEVIDENGIVLFSKSNVTSADKWGEFNVYFRTHDIISHTAQVKISLGEEDDEVSGLVYLDNFSLTSSVDYESQFASATNKADLSKLGLNQSTTSDLELSNYYTFSDGNNDFTSPINLSGAGGIIDGRNNQFNELYDNLKRDENFLVLSSKNDGFVKMTSKYSVTFSKDSYYKLSFDLATIFGDEALSSKTDEHDCKYGITIEIDGFDVISEILSANEFKNVEVFFKTGSEDKTPNIVIKLVSDCNKTYGTALISNLDITQSSETAYTTAQRSDELNERVYISNAIQTETDEDDSDTPSEDEEQSTSDNAWLLAPSIITALAVIVGIIGYALKHTKIKKVEKVKKESYDRKLAINHDAIMVEAQKRRDAELEALNKVKDSLINEKNALEKEYNDFIRTSREENGGTISRGLEKAFKAYSAKINKVNEKINIIKEKLDYTISAEYLLVIERRILAEQDENETKNKANKK